MNPIEVLLSLGANLGDRAATLRRAIVLLEELAIQGLRASALYETAPVGFTDQPPFLNCAIAGTTLLSASELFSVCKTIERELGRTPRPRWHEREIDIDIALYGSAVMTAMIAADALVIPHPQMHERRFVLVPANEVAPAMLHPVLNASIGELLEQFKYKTHEKNSVQVFIESSSHFSESQ